MKVLVVNNAAPFVRGGAEVLADELIKRLNATAGVEAELVRVPFRWEPADIIPEQILLNRNLQLYGVDRVIGLKFPAYLIPHSCKILWLLHQFRQAYDLYDAGTSHLCGHASGAHLRAQIQTADEQCFRDSRAIFTNSPVTQARLQKYNQVPSTLLYPPLCDEERFTGGEYTNYIFAGGRVCSGKRQHILVQAMCHVRSEINLVIAGPLDDPAYGASLKDIILANNLSSRVKTHFDFHSPADIADWVNGALACAYLPIDEDSLGYVTMESFSSGKAVLTAVDSGGVLELVRHGETGCVAEADPHAVARHLDQLASNRAKTISMGRTAKASLKARALSWEHTIEQLLSG